jgi:hypothetical protein
MERINVKSTENRKGEKEERRNVHFMQYLRT